MASTTGDRDKWDWVLSSRADDQLSQIDPKAQQRIVAKLDEVVSSEWREPEDFLDPLRTPRFGSYG